MRTKHTEIIKAWLDGAEVEFKLDGKWIPKSNDIVAFFEDTEYRIKPKVAKKYVLGDIFKVTHKYSDNPESTWVEDFILAQVSAHEFTLIGLVSGNRLSSTLLFDTYTLTEDDLWDLIDGPGGDRSEFEFEYIGKYKAQNESREK
jgi:hypothetical protein